MDKNRQSATLGREASERSQRPRILVAEDNVAVRELTRRLLECLGYIVDPVSSGLEVLVAVEATRYDLILMDCQMPLLDGYLAARRLRSRGERMPIIGYSATSTRDACVAVGMNDFLAKPAVEDKLAEILDRWLERRPRS